jgi:hypothetical protein
VSFSLSWVIGFSSLLDFVPSTMPISSRHIAAMLVSVYNGKDLQC